MVSTVYIAFGSNLGDRRANIERALESLTAISEGDMQVSSLWQSKAINIKDDASDFLNGAVCIRTSLPPRALLVALQEIEETLGRPRLHGSHQSRTIDLDIICIDDLILDTPDLLIPHPRARERAFVLAPLSEIAPALRLPGERKPVNELLNDAPAMDLCRLDEPG